MQLQFGLYITLLLVTGAFAALIASRRRNHQIPSWGTFRQALSDVILAARHQAIAHISSRRMVESALRDSEAKYREMMDSLPIAVYETDLSGNLTFGNRAGVELFGYEWSDFKRGLNVFDLLIPEDRNRALRNMADILSGGSSKLREYTAMRKDGSTFPVMISAGRVLRGEQVTGMKGFVLDISVRKQAEEAVRNSEERYQTLAEAAHDVIFTTDSRGILLYVNNFAASQQHRRPEELIGKPLASLLHWGTTSEQIETIRRVVDSRQPAYFEHKATLGTREVSLYTCLAPIPDNSGIVHSVLGISRDITEMVRMREDLRMLSLIDELTGLHNRRGFLALTRQQLKLAQRSGEHVSILLADFDGLKEVNDNFGHDEGDQALRAIAVILRETCRESDIVARLGGDEFAILAVRASPPEAHNLAQRIAQAVSAENASASRLYELSLSIGVVDNQNATPLSIEELLARSDRLMYEEKRQKHLSGARQGERPGQPA